MNFLSTSINRNGCDFHEMEGGHVEEEGTKRKKYPDFCQPLARTLLVLNDRYLSAALCRSEFFSSEFTFICFLVTQENEKNG